MSGGVFHVLVNLLDYKLPISTAIECVRLAALCWPLVIVIAATLICDCVLCCVDCGHSLPRAVSRNTITDLETPLYTSPVRFGLEAKGLSCRDPGQNVAAVYGVSVTDAGELQGYADQRYSQEYGVYNAAASNGIPWGQ